MSTQGTSSTQAISPGFTPSLSLLGLGQFAVSRRVIKIAFAVALCSAGAFGMLSDSTYISSSNAVVSAYVVDVRTPIDGTISGLPAAGTFVKSGQVLGSIDNPRSDREHLDNLLTLQSSSASTVAALTAERAMLQSQQKALLARSNQNSAAVAARLYEQAQAADQTLAGLRFALNEANIELRRTDGLHTEGIVSDADLDLARAKQLVAKQAVEAQQTAVANYRAQSADAAHGLLAEPGDASDVSYSRQRADEISMKLAENASALTIARGQADEASMSVQAETVREGLMRQSEVRAPIQGYLWKINATDGEGVPSGSSVLSLVNCNQQFVLVQVPQDRVPEIAINHQARIRLSGETEERTGTVAAISGDVLKLPNSKLAALPFQESSQQMATVTVRLEEKSGHKGMPDAAHSVRQGEATCVVGRAARVLIPTYSAAPGSRWFHTFF